MKKITILILVLVIIIPMFANAAWWNPISWLTFLENLFAPKIKIIYVPIATTTTTQSSPSTTTNVEAQVKVTKPTNPTNTQTNNGANLQTSSSVSAVNSANVQTYPPVTNVASSTPSNSQAYNESDFINGLKNVYNPYETNFNTYWSDIISTSDYSNINSLPSTAGWFSDATQILSTARSGVNNLEKNYPYLSLEDLTALNNLKDGVDEMYLAMDIYASLANPTNISRFNLLTEDQLIEISSVYHLPMNSTDAPYVTALTQAQISQMNADIILSNTYLQEVHDFLALN